MKSESSPSARVTMADVARDSGVSPATVSLVLRNKGGVGAETRQRVLDSAQALGYLFVPSKQSQSHKTVTNIGLVIKARPGHEPLPNHFYAPVVAGIETVCRRQHLNLLYATLVIDDDYNPLELPRLLTEQHTDGLLMVGTLLDAALTGILQRQQVPVVLVDAYAPADPYDAVISDNVVGAYQAASCLIQNGHRHIGIVGSLPRAYPSIQERRQGYLQALEAHELQPYFADCHLLPEEALAVTTDLLRQNPQISAVFGCNDEIAITAMQAGRALGRRVPGDLSVIGFDNIALAQHVAPPLTTMRVDKMEMGRLAAQLLLNRIEFPAGGKVRTIIRPQLVERDSVQSLR